MNRRDAEGAEDDYGEIAAEDLAPIQPARREPPAELNALTEAVIGAAIEMHRHLGPGYLESAYEEAMAVERRLRGIQFERQVPIPLHYKGYALGEGRADFIIEKRLLVELKAVESLHPVHKAQVIAYLKATGPATWLARQLQRIRAEGGSSSDRAFLTLGILRALCVSAVQRGVVAWGVRF
jgi:GxxExxY protein